MRAVRGHTLARSAGFTLPEVLVALMIVAMIAVTGGTLLLTSLNANARLKTADDRLQELQIARTIIRSDLAQLVARPTKDAFGNRRDSLFFGGQIEPRRPLLAFTRTGAGNPGAQSARSDLQYVEYWLEESRLIRRSWLYPDATDRTPMVERDILTGVTRLEITFGLKDMEGDWLEEWVAPASVQGGAGFAPPMVAVEADLEGLGVIRQIFATVSG